MTEVHWQLGMTVDDVEELVIKKAMGTLGPCKTKVAKAIGVSVRTLDNKLAKYKLADELKIAGQKKGQN